MVFHVLFDACMVFSEHRASACVKRLARIQIKQSAWKFIIFSIKYCLKFWLQVLYEDRHLFNWTHASSALLNLCFVRNCMRDACSSAQNMFNNTGLYNQHLTMFYMHKPVN